MPAPTRETDRFPQSWGYAAGIGLMVLGVIVAIFVVVTGFQSIYSDVRAFQRNVGNGELLQSFERGDYVLYNEEGVDLGPLDVRIVRNSDGLEVPATSIEDGVTYDVDGTDGEAAASFRLPTDDFYRIEVDSSFGEVAKFAIGGDVVEGPGSIIGRGLVFGGIPILLGLILLIWTAIQHARWRIRDQLSSRIDHGRRIVAETLGPDGEADVLVGQTSSRVSGLAERAQQGVARARTQLDRVVPPPANQPPPPPDAPVAASSLPAPPAAGVETAQAALDDASSQIGALGDEAAARVEALDRSGLADSLDAAFARVQERLAAGDSLRDIARDERVVAQDTAEAAMQQARQARTDAQAQLDAAPDPAEIRAAADAASQRLNDEARAAAEAATADARGSLDVALERLDPVGQDLAGDLAGTAAVAGVAAATAVTGALSGIAEGVGILKPPPDHGAPTVDADRADAGAGVEPEPIAATEVDTASPAPVDAAAVAAPAANEAVGAPPAPAASAAPSVRDAPTSSPILAPPPAAQSRFLAEPPTPTRPTFERPRPRTDAPTTDTAAAADAAQGVADALDPVEARAEPAPARPSATGGFSIAPPPAFRSTADRPPPSSE